MKVLKKKEFLYAIPTKLKTAMHLNINLQAIKLQKIII